MDDNTSLAKFILQEYIKFHKFQVPVDISPLKLIKTLEKEVKYDMVCYQFCINVRHLAFQSYVELPFKCTGN